MGERYIRASNIIDFPKPQEYLINGNNALKADIHPVFHPQIIDFEKYRTNPLKDKINHFDLNWRQEGLPQDWYNIDDVGFSIRRQMRLLDKSNDPNSWSEQSGRDLLGFGLEYLKQGTFFPYEYQAQGQSLIETKYGGRKMIDTVDPKEREGSVVESLQKAEDFLLSSGDGASVIMVSPPGPTGLTLDDGSNISYKDTMIFHMQKKGDGVIGSTIRVNFNLQKAKELIRQLTGQELGLSASVIDCVKAVAFINPTDDFLPKTPEDLVGVLENISGSGYSYQDKTWLDTKKDIKNRDALYDFDQTTQEMIHDFKDYVVSPRLSRFEIQKALAATFLRISKHLLVDVKNIPTPKYQIPGKIDFYPDYQPMTYGAVVDKVKKLPGCMGGGGSVTSVNSIIPRSGSVEKDGSEEWFTCPKCTYKADGPVGNKCPGCGLTKEEFVEDGGAKCD